MGLHDRFGLSTIVNAAGTFTPLGVSRSSPIVASDTAAVLQDFVIIDELLDRACNTLTRWAKTEAATVVHCAAAGITLAVAAMLCGRKRGHIQALPAVEDRPNTILVPAGHDVNYGHELTQAIRLAGAEVVIASDDLQEIEAAGIVLVSSRLVRSQAEFSDNLKAAKASGLPILIDAAAQDLRIDELVSTGADMLVLSAQKYLAAPTAGLIVGKKIWVDAVRAQFSGIGRCMKPSKEAIVGVLSAIEERERTDLQIWSQSQAAKVEGFVDRANKIDDLRSCILSDPTGLPFLRAAIDFDNAEQAKFAAEALKKGDPKIFAMEHELASGRLIFELVPLRSEEIDTILDRLSLLDRKTLLP